MKWNVVERDRSRVRLELFEGAGIYGRQYINLSGSIANGYKWYSGTTVMGHSGFSGTFKDESQDAAIETAIKQWDMRLQEIVDAFLNADLPVAVESLEEQQ